MLKRIQYNAPVTLTFALVSLGALLLSMVDGGWANAHLFSVYRSSFRDPFAYLRVFLHVLGHSGYSHYLGNMLLILALGPGLEERYGSKPILWCILITALVTGLAQILLFPGAAVLGASGVAFMMIVLSSMAGMRDGKLPLSMLLILVIYLGGEVLNGLFRKDNVSQLSHVIGGLCGGEFGFLLPLRRKR
jgi:membrane associated rhomboid family serine protease